MDKVKVGIIVLNWNGKEKTLSCLKSLEKITTTQAQVQVLVIDNNSTDDSVSQIKKDFPHLELLVNDQNYGYSGGNNVGIQKLLNKDTDWVLLLNNDTVVEPDFLDNLLKFATSRDKIGIVGPMLKFKRGFEVFYDLGGSVNPLFGRTSHREVSLVSNEPPRRADYVSGACMLIHRSVFDKIGLLDEDYFFGFEDVDFCLTAQENGFEVYCVPTSLVEHQISASFGQTSPLKIYYMVRNNLRFVYKKFIFPKNIIGYFYILVLSFKIFLNSARFYQAIIHAWLDFLRGKFGARVTL